MVMPTIYCDLDGVLVDFDAGVVKVCDGKHPDELSARQMWPRLARTPDFYANLPWMEDGRRLWEHIRMYRPKILTGLPVGTWAAPQKIAWCRRELGEEVEVITCMSKKKHEYCKSPQSILIDDRLSLKEAWEAAGGIFLHHVNADQTIQLLKDLNL